MRYAEVSVNSPLAQRRTFSYEIPPGMKVSVGQAVRVPFGSRTLQGIVLELVPHPTVDAVQEITGLITPGLILPEIRVELARWLSDYYLSPLFETLALMLPPGFGQQALTFVAAAPDTAEYETASLSQEQRQVLALARGHGKISLKQLERSLGKKKAQAAVSQLVARNRLVRSYELEPVRIRPKQVAYLHLNIPAPEAWEQAAGERKKRALKMAALLELLSGQADPLPAAEVRKKLGVTKTTIDALVKRGLVTVRETRVTRDPLGHLPLTVDKPPTLTRAQQKALDAVSASLRSSGGEPSVFLLYGVTGSGKTEVYLRALAEAIKLGKRGIALVPEIALTPQAIERFAARFPRRVAILHSRLSPGEQFDEWHRISQGEFDVVIGPRSALFAPQPELGLIIVDEEHEWSYQQDVSPRYHAREVALELARRTGAVVILGSATPDVSTFYRAQRGDYRLLELPERVVPEEAAPLPRVEIVDMREELKAGQRGLFSRSLSEAIARTVVRREQAILFLNRRGGASFVQCRSCGYTFRCRRCEVSLTHHPDKNCLICHQCHYQAPVPGVCPRCRSQRLNFLGTGTQKLEQEARFTFPQARLLRWDSDTTGSQRSHEAIINRFRAREADILIGTQMVAKGLDLPGVTLVGVINADTSLNLPDFRAGERTFQLLSQVAGRAGRGSSGGRVIIQTYSPEHYAIEAASKHDYVRFYEKEIAYRRLLGNPPFKQLARLVYGYRNDLQARREAERLKRVLTTEIASKGLDDITVLGPAPAFISRLKGSYRWQLILRGSHLSHLLAQIPLPRGWTADIDPVGLG